MDLLIIIGILALCLFLCRKVKLLSPGNLVLFTGSLRGGKSVLSLWQAYKAYQRRYNAWLFDYIFRSAVKADKPIFYSNIQLNLPRHVRCCWLTEDIVLRRKKLAPNCVCFVDEISLLARAADWSDVEVSDVLTDFIKLYGHETWGGALYINTQSLADNHHAIKRCISYYYYIHSRVFLPFFVLLRVKELTNDPASGEQSLERIDGGLLKDFASSLRWVLVPKKTFGWYDTHTFSGLTDDLELDAKPMERSYNLKTYNVLTVSTRRRARCKSSKDGDRHEDGK